MSTKASLFYGDRYGHIFREMGDGEYYWQRPGTYHHIRLPFRFMWAWLDRQLMLRRQRMWKRGKA